MKTLDLSALMEDPADANLLRLAEMTEAEAAQLVEYLTEAVEYQWRRPPSVQPDLDTGERSQGIYSDPTADVALDGRRLRLRAAVLTSERALRVSLLTLRKARQDLARAREHYVSD